MEGSTWCRDQKERAEADANAKSMKVETGVLKNYAKQFGTKR